MANQRSQRHSLELQGINAAWEYKGFVDILRYLSAPKLYVRGWFNKFTSVTIYLDVDGTPETVEWVNTNATPTNIQTVASEITIELNNVAGVTASVPVGSTVINIAQLNVDITDIEFGYVTDGGTLLWSSGSALLWSADDALRWK